MVIKKILRFIEDIWWTYRLPPHTYLSGLTAVGRQLLWHLIMKHIRSYRLGHFQGMLFLYDLKSDGAAHAFIEPEDDYSFQLFLKWYLKAKMVFVDIGANVGTETLIAAQRGAYVHAFEPTQKTFDNLLINVRLNGFGELCVLNQKAVAAKTGMVKFFAQSEDVSLANSLVKQEGYHQVVSTVACISLDEYSQDQALSEIDLLKIDVEGAEEQVFKGAAKLLAAHKIQCIFWEANDRATADDRQKTLDLLKKYGYENYYIEPNTKRMVPWAGHHDCLSLLPGIAKKAQRHFV